MAHRKRGPVVPLIILVETLKDCSPKHKILCTLVKGKNQDNLSILIQDQHAHGRDLSAISRNSPFSLLEIHESDCFSHACALLFEWRIFLDFWLKST